MREFFHRVRIWKEKAVVGQRVVVMVREMGVVRDICTMARVSRAGG